MHIVSPYEDEVLSHRLYMVQPEQTQRTTRTGCNLIDHVANTSAGGLQ